MNEFKNWVLEHANTKVAVIVATGIMVLIIFLFIFSKTSLGKKALNKLSSKIDSAAEKSEKTFKEIEQFKDEQTKKLAEERDFYKKELAVVSKKKDDLANLVCGVLPLLHNKKVDALLEEYKKKDTENVETDKILEEIDKVAETSEKGVNNGTEERIDNNPEEKKI